MLFLLKLLVSNKLVLTAFFVVLLDQLSKLFMETRYSVSHNYGAAFGLFQGQRFLLIFAALLVVFLVFKYRKEYDYLALGFLLGGTIGNLIDRLLKGYVVDFINLGFWPSFNLADAFSTIGVFLLIYYSTKN